MKKRRSQQNKRLKKGDVYMQTIVNRNIDNLRKRALKRRISFSAQKGIEDVKVENDFFEDVKKQIYNQVTEEKK